MDKFNLREYLKNNPLLKENVGEGEPLNDSDLLNLLQQNMADVLSQIDSNPEDTTNLKFEFDGDGDASIVPIGYTGYSFRRLGDVDHIGPIGIENIDDEYAKPFEGQDGDEPRPINVAGTDLMYIAYNI